MTNTPSRPTSTPTSTPDSAPTSGPAAPSGSSQFAGPDLRAARFQPVPVESGAGPLTVAASALALLGLLVGVPAVLLALGGGPPLPTGLPGRGWLSDAIGIEQLVAVLLAVVWVAWLQFAVCTAVEVVAALRGGVLATAVPLAGPAQRLARGLVTGLLLSATLAVQVTAGSAAAPPAPVAVVSVDVGAAGQVVDGGAGVLRLSPAVASDAVVDDAPAVARGAGGSAPTGAVVVPVAVLGGAVDADDLAALAGRRVYVVAPPHGRHHDSLWDIAERHLGDGRRWPEIHALNKGRAQPDGRSLELARLIQPGWYLVMPDDALGVERFIPPAPPAPTQDGAALDTAAPDTAAPDTASPDTASPDTAALDTAALDTAAPDTAALDTAALDTAAPDDSVAKGVSAPVGPGAASAAPPRALAPAATADDARRVAAELGGAGLLGAGLLGALLVARRRGRPTAPPDVAVEAEVWLRVGADPGRARFVDTALRSLAGLCRTQGRPFPDVYAVVADDDELAVLLAPAHPDAPAPWTAVEAGARWVLQRGNLPRGGGHAEPPLPSLVALGRDEAGRDVLVDLAAAAGPVCITGDPVVAGHVVRALAVELATNPWSRGVRVTAVDLPAALAVVGGGLMVPQDAADPLAELRSRFDAAAGRPDRTSGAPGEHLAFGRPPGREVADDLRRLGAVGRLGIVVAGDVPGARWRLEVDADGALHAPDLVLRLTANRIGDATLALLGDLFAAADGAPTAMVIAQHTPQHTPQLVTQHVPAPADRPSLDRPSLDRPGLDGPGWYTDVPQPAAPAEDTAWGRAPARVGLLGPVLVRAPGALAAARVDLAAEVVAFLALHPDGVHPTVLGGAVWPRGATADVRDATLDRVRAWLGDGVLGPRLLTAADGRLLLDPEVVVDWAVLCTLLRSAGRAAGSPAEQDLLGRALALVRGPFAGGAAGGSYSWLPRTGLERTVPRVVTAAAHRLAVLRLPDDPAAAGEAARCGLRADPCAQVVWRDLLRAEHAQWGADGVRQAASQMLDVLADLGTAPEPATEALVDDLCPGARALAGGA